MAKSVFRRFPTDDLIWGSPDADESDGGPMFFRDVLGQNAWEIGEDFWEAPAGGAFVDLAASLAGAQVVAAALAVMRALGAALAGLGSLEAALAMLRALAATASGSEAVTAGLDRLVNLAGGAAGANAAAAAIGILRGLVAEILGVGAAVTEVDVARALAAAADGAMQISAELAVEGGEPPEEEGPPVSVPGWTFGMIDRYLRERAIRQEEEELVVVLR